MLTITHNSQSTKKERWHQDALWEARGGSVTVLAMFCWETLGPGIHVDVILSRITYQNIVADQVHPSMPMIFPNGSGFLSAGSCTLL